MNKRSGLNYIIKCSRVAAVSGRVAECNQLFAKAIKPDGSKTGHHWKLLAIYNRIYNVLDSNYVLC